MTARRDDVLRPRATQHALVSEVELTSVSDESTLVTTLVEEGSGDIGGDDPDVLESGEVNLWKPPNSLTEDGLSSFQSSCSTGRVFHARSRALDGERVIEGSVKDFFRPFFRSPAEPGRRRSSGKLMWRREMAGLLGAVLEVSGNEPGMCVANASSLSCRCSFACNRVWRSGA